MNLTGGYAEIFCRKPPGQRTLSIINLMIKKHSPSKLFTIAGFFFAAAGFLRRSFLTAAAARLFRNRLYFLNGNFHILRSLCNGFDLRAAFGAGNDNFSLACRNTANGLAGFAGKIFVFLICVAGFSSGMTALQPPQPVDPLLVFLPPLVEILGKHPEKQEHTQNPHQYGTGCIFYSYIR